MKNIDFDIPEFNRIRSMMDDLIPTESTVSNSKRPEARSASRSRRNRRLASYSLADFSEAINWKNTLGFHSKLTASVGTSSKSRIGSVTLRKYSESVNWKNALDGPQLILAAPQASGNSGPPETVDTFFEQISWE